MSSSTTPVQAQSKRTSRRSSDNRDTDPHVSPISSYAYGSCPLNQLPRLPETKIRLADRLQAATDVVNARLKAEEEEREREAAIKLHAASRNSARGSMAPPSPPRSRYSREPSAAIEHNYPSSRDPSELSDVTALISADMSPSYASEDAIGLIVGNTFRKYRNEIHHNEAIDLPTEIVSPSPSPLDSGVCLTGRSLRSSVAPGQTGPSRDNQKSAQAPNKPNTNIRMASSIRPSKFKARLDGSTTTSAISGKNDVVKNGSKQSVARGKENISTSSDIGKASTNNTSRPTHQTDRSATGTFVPRKRRSKRPTESGDHGDESPSLLRQPFDWGFQHYYNVARWEYKIYFSLAWILVMGLIFYQWYGSGIDFTTQLPFYTHPMQAPSNYQEVADRVHLLEKELSSLDSRIGKRIDSETLKLVAGLATLSATASNSASKSEVKETAATLNKLKDQLFSLQKSTQQYKKDMDKKFNGLMTPKERRDEIQRAVQSALPPQLAATIKQDGSVELTREFRRTIEDIFNEFFPKKLNQKMQGASSDGIKAVPSWELFLEKNKERLRSTIDERVNEAAKDQAVLSKETVMMMVREQMEHLQNKWEKENLYPLFDQRLSSFQDSFESQQSVAFATMVQTAVASAISAATSTASRVARSYTSSAEKTSGVLTAAGVQVPDFASQLTGAYVWPYLTSATYVPPRVTTMWRFLDFSNSLRYIPHPGTAISPSFDVGDCWPFAGSYGIIAIKLSNLIYPTHVTIEHVRKELTPDISVAPKTIEFWAQLMNQTENTSVEQAALRIANATGQESIESRSLRPGPVVLGKESEVDPHAKSFVKLHTFTYDIDGDAVQSFELPVDMTNLGVAVRLVALVIKENHGSETHTCLYRTKVHGFSLKKPKEQNSGTQSAGAQSAGQTKGWWG